MLTLLKSLVIPIVDYCSQLCAPHTKSLLQKVEMIQRNFIKKINGSSNLSYWDQLRRIQTLLPWATKRTLYNNLRMEDNWKQSSKLQSNQEEGIEIGGISWYNHIRLGRKCRIASIQRGPFQMARSISLARQGPKLFNCLPKSLRNASNCSTDSFKQKLDKNGLRPSLMNTPDPRNYTAGMRRRESNSISDMLSIGLHEMDAWRTHKSLHK